MTALKDKKFGKICDTILGNRQKYLQDGLRSDIEKHLFQYNYSIIAPQAGNLMIRIILRFINETK